MRFVLKRLVNNAVLDEFGGQRHMAASASKSRWRQLMDSDMLALGENQTLKSILEERVLKPLKQLERQDGFEGKNTGVKPAYSMILFGPPGTAKTTICSSMAFYLGWDFVTIDTAEFLADGLTNVASRMRHIFERLKALDRCVILFDEIEEFCLDREDPKLSMESRLLTTAMLTQLNDLRRQASSVFVIATNRIRSFDAAIIRPGRIDMQLFVGVPNYEARVKRLESKLSQIDMPEAEKEVALQQVTDFMKAHWTDQIRFLTFAENEKFLSSAANMAKSGDIGYSRLMEVLASQMPTAMITGPLKNEYLVSEKLTRV